jgi:very-short-patch-repair endonuclease
MRQHDGIAHSSVMREAGFSDYQLRLAVADGRLIRIRRSWLAAPWCDGSLRAAAGAGGRLTCVSAAQRLDLWTPAHEFVHIAVAANASRFDTAGLVVHWSRGPAPVAPHATVEPLLNVLSHAARCLPRLDTLALWESALRRGQIHADVLPRVRWRDPRADALASVAGSLSDSGIETRFVALMRSIGVAVRQQVWIDGQPLDGLIGECLAIQIDGFAHHSRPNDRRRDLRADARLALRGITVLRFDYQQLLFDPDYVIDTVRTAMAQELHLRARTRSGGRRGTHGDGAGVAPPRPRQIG